MSTLPVSTEHEVFKPHTPAGRRSSSLKNVEIHIQDYLTVNRISEQDVESILIQDIQTVLIKFQTLQRDSSRKVTKAIINVFESFCFTVSRYLSSCYKNDRRVVLRRLQLAFGAAAGRKKWERRLEQMQATYGADKVSRASSLMIAVMLF